MKNKKQTSPLLNTKELAAYLRVTTRTVAKLLQRKAIPVVRVNTLNRFRIEKVIEALEQNPKALDDSEV